ncbi:uncharacterized protein WM277_008694 [Molossus nigricans]
MRGKTPRVSPRAETCRSACPPPPGGRHRRATLARQSPARAVSSASLGVAAGAAVEPWAGSTAAGQKRVRTPRVPRPWGHGRCWRGRRSARSRVPPGGWDKRKARPPQPSPRRLPTSPAPPARPRPPPYRAPRPRRAAAASLRPARRSVSALRGRRARRPLRLLVLVLLVFAAEHRRAARLAPGRPGQPRRLGRAPPTPAPHPAWPPVRLGGGDAGLPAAASQTPPPSRTTLARPGGVGPGLRSSGSEPLTRRLRAAPAAPPPRSPARARRSPPPAGPPPPQLRLLLHRDARSGEKRRAAAPAGTSTREGGRAERARGRGRRGRAQASPAVVPRAHVHCGGRRGSPRATRGRRRFPRGSGAVFCLGFCVALRCRNKNRAVAAVTPGRDLSETHGSGSSPLPLTLNTVTERGRSGRCRK